MQMLFIHECATAQFAVYKVDIQIMLFVFVLQPDYNHFRVIQIERYIGAPQCLE